MVFIDFWGPGDILDQDVYRNILTCLDCMTVFGPVSANGLKDIISDQVARWDFGNFLVPFGIPRKKIVVDAYGLFSGMFKKSFQ